MLHRAKIFGLISGLAVLIAACSGGSQSATNPDSATTDSSATVPASSPVAQKQTSEASSTTIPGVKSISEVKLQIPPANAQYGFFDSVNDSGAPIHNVEKTGNVKLTGWAVIADKGKAADKVIITLADNKTVVAVANVNLARPDVVKAINNPGYKNAGWNTTVKASALPGARVELKAWAYDSATKTATPLTRTHTVIVAD